MLDLDHFKQINDTYGHLAGDTVLRAVAETMTAAVRSGDAVGRWGGEEFAILLPAVNATELRSIAERIHRHIRALAIDLAPDTTADSATGSEPATASGLTVSIGGALYPSSGITTVDDLVVAADTALYAAKQAGRDRVILSPAGAMGSNPPHQEPPAP
jgi:diguanylate cyclase (GGDEF)-like protein